MKSRSFVCGLLKKNLVHDNNYLSAGQASLPDFVIQASLLSTQSRIVACFKDLRSDLQGGFLRKRHLAGRGSASLVRPAGFPLVRRRRKTKTCKVSKAPQDLQGFQSPKTRKVSKAPRPARFSKPQDLQGFQNLVGLEGGLKTSSS